MNLQVSVVAQLGERIECVQLTPYQYCNLQLFEFEREFNAAYRNPSDGPTFQQFNWFGRWYGWTIARGKYDEALDVTDVMIAYFLTERAKNGARVHNVLWKAALQHEAPADKVNVVQALYTRASQTPFGTRCLD
jgi:hypothetical protein